MKLTRPLLTALLLLAFASFAHADKFPPPVVPEGLGLNTGHGSLGLRDDDFEAIKAAGVRYIRVDFTWDQIERTRGEYNFAAYDKLIAKLKKHGVKPIILLAYGNKLYDPDGGGINTEEGRAGYAKFAATVVKKYNKEIEGIVYELWNEPNTEMFWRPRQNAEQYTALVQAASVAMREADPAAIIVSGGVTDLGWDQTRDFLEDCFALGLLKHVDGVGVHLHGGASNNKVERVTDQLKWLRKTIVEYDGDPKTPIVNTQFEADFDKDFKGDRDTKLYAQAAVATRMYLMCLMNDVKLNVWYQWRWRDGQSGHAVVESDGTPRPIYHALQIFTATFKGYRFEDRVDLKSPADYALRFKSGDKQQLAVWTTDAAHDMAIDVRTSRTELPVIDMMGNKSTVPVRDSKAIVPASTRPVYVEVTP